MGFQRYIGLATFFTLEKYSFLSNSNVPTKFFLTLPVYVSIKRLIYIN